MREGIIISSNDRYLDVVVPPLIESLSSAPKESIVVFVGGETTQYKSEFREGIEYVWVPCNAYDNNAVWGLIHYRPDRFEKVFLLHDTCKAGPLFLEKAMTLYDPTAEVTAADTDESWSCWCGLAMWDVGFLIRCKNFYEQYRYVRKGMDQGLDGGTPFRRLAQRRAYYTGSVPPVFLGTEKVYGGADRLISYLPSIDLYKYHANWTDRSNIGWVEEP
jgi:hypothetical protein